MNIQYDENHWKQMEAALGMLLGSGYGYGTPLIDDLVELSTIVDEAMRAVDIYDVDGVVHLMDHTDASIYGEFRDKYKWLADFSSEIGNSLYHEVDRPFYENIDAYAVAMRDLDINKFTTENKYGIRGETPDGDGDTLKKNITLSDLLSGGTELENFARKEFELWQEMTDVPGAQELKYEDYQKYMMYSRSFNYHSLNDQLVGTVRSVVVGTTLFGLGFVPIVGPILGAGFGIMEVKEAVQGVDASGRELDIFERIFKGAIGVTSIGFSGWKLAKDLGGMNAVKGVSGDGFGEETVTYRRVQGGKGSKSSQNRIVVDDNGNVYINNKDKNFNISVDEGEHAKHFLENNRQGADLIEFEVPKWFDDFVQENMVPQAGYKNNPASQGGTAPKLTDPGTPGTSIEFPKPWSEWIEEYAINGRIIKGGN